MTRGSTENKSKDEIALAPEWQLQALVKICREVWGYDKMIRLDKANHLNNGLSVFSAEALPQLEMRVRNQPEHVDANGNPQKYGWIPSLGEYDLPRQLCPRVAAQVAQLAQKEAGSGSRAEILFAVYKYSGGDTNLRKEMLADQLKELERRIASRKTN